MVKVPVHVETVGWAAGRMTVGAEHVHTVHEIGHFGWTVVLDGDLLLPDVHRLRCLQQLVHVNGAGLVVIVLEHCAVCGFQVPKPATTSSPHQ